MAWTAYTHLLSVRALPLTTININGVRSGSIIDTGVFGNDFRTVLFVVYTGAVTDGSHAVTAQESSDASSWTDIPAARIQGDLPTIVAADDFRQEGLDFGVIANARYLRLQVTSSAVSSGGTIGASAVLGEGSDGNAVRTGS